MQPRILQILLRRDGKRQLPREFSFGRCLCIRTEKKRIPATTTSGEARDRMKAQRPYPSRSPLRVSALTSPPLP
ncbi:hypothetical protein E2C01_048515 [Portunus trituberculatus]|uniref:Uncharacterized protein n=1 Tax=Portunus trituberculatus TaxID=210409 RepID=A0A5B7G6M2_PORTR|nr:hypothetical protein [Portunus trituberculatus]